MPSPQSLVVRWRRKASQERSRTCPRGYTGPADCLRSTNLGYSIVILLDTIDRRADVAELVDALDLGSSALVA